MKTRSARNSGSQIVIPIVLVIIFVLLYMTYPLGQRSVARPASGAVRLTGGIFLLKFLGYNFSVAVWVGFIALFGTAVQTGVVMVIYLEEAVRRKIDEQGTASQSNACTKPSWRVRFFASGPK